MSSPPALTSGLTYDYPRNGGFGVAPVTIANLTSDQDGDTVYTLVDDGGVGGTLNFVDPSVGALVCSDAEPDAGIYHPIVDLSTDEGTNEYTLTVTVTAVATGSPAAYFQALQGMA